MRCPEPSQPHFDFPPIPFQHSPIDLEDYYFILSDYSQIELRVLADLSKDETLVSSFSNPTVDFFDDLSAKWVDRFACLFIYLLACLLLLVWLVTESFSPKAIRLTSGNRLKRGAQP